MDLELIKKLNHFNVYANLGFQFDGIDNFEKYKITYHNKIKDYWYNFITDIKANNKDEFDKIILEASSKMKAKNRDVAIAILPYMEEIYRQREIFFDSNYELVSNEVWQIFDNFEELDDIKTNCSLNVKLEKTTDMKLYSEEMIKAYQTGDADNPYGDLDSIYKEVYENYKKVENVDWLLHEAMCMDSEADIFKPYEKMHSTVKTASEIATSLNVKNLVLYHASDNDLENRKRLYIEEAKQYFNGNINAPDDLDVIEL